MKRIRPVMALVTSVRFLTVVPVPGRGLDGPDALGRAAAWFPLVGLALGVVLFCADRILSALFPPLLSALLVLTTWKLVTGGIHLDGLADCLDGLGARDRDHVLAVMRDSRIGTFGALGLIFLLLIALVALAELSRSARGVALLLAPMAGRYAPLLLARLFRPAVPEGSGSAFMRAVSWPSVLGGGALVAAGAGAAFGVRGEVVASVGLAAACVAGFVFSRRLGGLTGDGLGAGVELAELGVVLAVLALARLVPA
jgi:adenosylcobinamide-GDP ribazoletransferase